ncbi:uncharacterized protein L201_007434 [Kwoniella dendrophila CBS 6074]|uniref:Uncharacterized protein n=1 Tax=Kwoniella dendrophila CBS 6074 TaxID=1295534 RepID=A0AAX4K419_9TREE
MEPDSEEDPVIENIPKLITGDIRTNASAKFKEHVLGDEWIETDIKTEIPFTQVLVGIVRLLGILVYFPYYASGQSMIMIKTKRK